jgi:hypothetical protein
MEAAGFEPASAQANPSDTTCLASPEFCHQPDGHSQVTVVQENLTTTT